jgi:hypothetical protein
MQIIALIVIALFLTMPGLTASYADSTTTVAVGGLYEVLQPYLLQLVGVLAAALVGWLAELVRRYLNLSIDKQNRDALQRALMTGAGLLLSKIQAQADNTQIDVKNPMVKEVLDHVIASSPDAIKYFGLTPEVLAEKIAAKVALIRSGATNA